MPVSITARDQCIPARWHKEVKENAGRAGSATRAFAAAPVLRSQHLAFRLN